jgi:hypothetical protein
MFCCFRLPPSPFSAEPDLGCFFDSGLKMGLTPVWKCHKMAKFGVIWDKLAVNLFCAALFFPVSGGYF